MPNVGDKIYVPTRLSISHGSDDVVGGLATVTKVSHNISGGVVCEFVSVAEHPGRSYNWDQFLKDAQEKLRAEFGESVAYPDPDIDTPWIEDGDCVV